MNEKYTPDPHIDPTYTPDPAAPVVSAEPSIAPQDWKLEDDRSLNPPSVPDALLRSFASIYDSVLSPNDDRSYIIFGEYGNYSDFSMYILGPDSTLNSNGTVSGTYTRYRIWSDYNGDNRYQVYPDRSSALVFPSLGDTRSAYVYSNVLGYRPNPYIVELQHSEASSVSSVMSVYLLAFASMLILIWVVITSCFRK